MAGSLFISDLHLNRAQPKLTQLFLDFLGWAQRQQATLYILGDLFDAWIGDDAPDPAMRPVLTALKQYSDRAGPVLFMHGNRDFLLGEQFCRETGGQLLQEHAVVRLIDEPVLLCHGDSLCTDDVLYQALRGQLRDRAFIAQFLQKTVEQRLAIAQQLREQSKQSVAEKAETIMDVNQAAVEQCMTQYGVRHLIHGHTHRMAHHRWQLQHAPVERIVLGDWREQEGYFLSVGNSPQSACSMLTFPSMRPAL